jgi:hypothetical protein
VLFPEPDVLCPEPKVSCLESNVLCSESNVSCLGPNVSGHQASTPINIDRLRLELACHPDRNFVNYLLDGLINGFDTMVSATDLPTKECKNLQSAFRQPDDVDILIESDVDNGFLNGPFDTHPFPSYRVSPIGVVEGKYSGKKRLIVDLSAPHDHPEHPSINDLIDKDQCSLTYTKLDDAIRGIVRYGVSTQLCKIDISSAFKILPISPSQYHLFCIKWRGRYYYHTRLAFGCRSSCVIFDNLSRAICWIAKHNYNIETIFHVLDDFLTLNRADYCAERTMAVLNMIFHRLRIPIAEHKTMGPSPVMEYLGIELDTIKMQARLPQNKVDRIVEFLDTFLARKTCTKRELLQLLGHLYFASRVILAGRSFVSYLLSLSTTVKELHHHVHLNNSCREDLRMWHKVLAHWNGVSLFHQTQLTVAADWELYTDAASTVGHGGYFQGKWFCETWPADLPSLTDNNLSMAFRELYPIVVAAILWGSEWSTKRILFHCDNMATVEIIRKGRSRAPDVMHLVRRLTWCSALYNFTIYAEFLPGAVNVVADALSRQQLQRFRQLCPDAQLTPCLCPPVTKVLWDFAKSSPP